MITRTVRIEAPRFAANANTNLFLHDEQFLTDILQVWSEHTATCLIENGNVLSYRYTSHVAKICC
jgi:hypothetical protein